MSRKIAKALNMEIDKKENLPIVINPQISDVDENQGDIDYQYARNNFYSVIEKGNEALEEMLEVAKESEHPRAFEVVSTLMKTIIDANKTLVDMANDKKKCEQENNESHKNSNGGGTTNQIFVGSTSELQKMLKDIRENGQK